MEADQNVAGGAEEAAEEVHVAETERAEVDIAETERVDSSFAERRYEARRRRLPKNRLRGLSDEADQTVTEVDSLEAERGDFRFHRRRRNRGISAAVLQLLPR